MSVSCACSASAGWFSHERSGPEKQSENEGGKVHEKHHHIEAHHSWQRITGHWQTFSSPLKATSPGLLTNDHGEGKDKAAQNKTPM